MYPMTLNRRIRLRNISSIVILMELRHRVSDQLFDPEPQYDAFLSDLTMEELRGLYDLLDKSYKIGTKEV